MQHAQTRSRCTSSACVPLRDTYGFIRVPFARPIFREFSRIIRNSIYIIRNDNAFHSRHREERYSAARDIVALYHTLIEKPVTNRKRDYLRAQLQMKNVIHVIVFRRAGLLVTILSRSRPKSQIVRLLVRVLNFRVTSRE